MVRTAERGEKTKTGGGVEKVRLWGVLGAAAAEIRLPECPPPGKFGSPRRSVSIKSQKGSNGQRHKGWVLPPVPFCNG